MPHSISDPTSDCAVATEPLHEAMVQISRTDPRNLGRLRPRRQHVACRLTFSRFVALPSTIYLLIFFSEKRKNEKKIALASAVVSHASSDSSTRIKSQTTRARGCKAAKRRVESLLLFVEVTCTRGTLSVGPHRRYSRGKLINRTLRFCILTVALV